MFKQEILKQSLFTTAIASQGLVRPGIQSKLNQRSHSQITHRRAPVKIYANAGKMEFPDEGFGKSPNYNIDKSKPWIP